MISTDLVDSILNEYQRTRSPFKAAKAVGVEVATVWQVIDTYKDRIDSHKERNGGYGPPQLRKHLVARKRATEVWDNHEGAIAKARSDYERGLVELVTSRDGNWLLLYAIPRRQVQPRPHYFQLGV